MERKLRGFEVSVFEDGDVEVTGVDKCKVVLGEKIEVVERPERVSDADLNAESAKAASHWMQETGALSNPNLAEVQNWNNCVASGFYMGFRFYENLLRGKKDAAQ